MSFFIFSGHEKCPKSGYNLRMFARNRFLPVLLASLSVAVVVVSFYSPVHAYCNGCTGYCCGCPGEAQCMDGYSSCEEACGLSSGVSNNNNNTYDDSAERAQRAADRAAARAAEREEEEAARATRQVTYDEIHGRVEAAFERRDWKEALRLSQEQKAFRDGPKVREAIKEFTALVDWEKAKTSDELRRAYNMYPKTFSPEDLALIKEREAAEKNERERPKREATEKKRREELEKRDREAALKAHKALENVVGTLQTPVPPDTGITRGPNTNDAFGTKKADPNLLEFGDPASQESVSIQARKGWESDGKLIGTQTTISTPPIPETVEIVAKDPRMIEANQEVTRLNDETTKMEADISRLTKERGAATDAKKMKDLTAQLDVATSERATKLVDLANAKEKQTKVHRIVVTEVSKKSKNTGTHN